MGCFSCDRHLLLQISGDRGKTWNQPRAIDPQIVQGGQYDSQITVDPTDGKTVLASVLQNSKSSIAVMKSTDFGQTWHNTLVSDGSNQLGRLLGGGGGIDSQGTIYFTFDGYTQNGQAKGPVNLWTSVSHDGGATWLVNTVGVSGAPYPCSNCGFAFLGAAISMAIGSDDTAYVLWNATVDQTDNAPERVYFAKSTDHGATFSIRQDVSLAPQGVEHAFPAITTGATAGDVRIGWTDTRTDGNRNVWYCSSADGGVSWSGETRISGYVPGYNYLTASGFGLPYGDYFEMDVDSANSTQLVWGESGSYAGPGNIWTAHN